MTSSYLKGSRLENPGEKQEKGSSWLPPDGGYGWVIVFASFLIWFLSVSYIQVGIFMLEFAPHFGVSMSAFGWLNAAQTVTGRMLGIFSGILIQKLGCRKGTLVSTVLVSGGYLASAFATNTTVMYFTYGFLPGIGMGGLFICAMVAPQQYFHKHRSLATGLAITGMSAGFFCWPLIATALIDQQGYKLAFISEAAIVFLVGSIATVLLRPPGIKSDAAKEKYNTAAGESHLMTPKAGKKEVVSQPTNHTPSLLVDVKALRIPAFAIFLISNIFGALGYLTITVYMTPRSMLLGIQKNVAALHTSAFSLSNGISTFVFAGISNIENINRGAVFCAGQFLTGVLAMISVTFSRSPLLFTYAVLTGISLGVIQGSQQALIVDITSPDLVPSATGWYIFIHGLAHLISHPLTGWLFDTTEDPHNPFYMAGVMGIVGGLGSLHAAWTVWKTQRSPVATSGDKIEEKIHVAGQKTSSTYKTLN